MIYRPRRELFRTIRVRQDTHHVDGSQSSLVAIAALNEVLPILATISYRVMDSDLNLISVAFMGPRRSRHPGGPGTSWSVSLYVFAAPLVTFVADFLPSETYREDVSAKRPEVHKKPSLSDATATSG